MEQARAGRVSAVDVEREGAPPENAWRLQLGGDDFDPGEAAAEPAPASAVSGEPPVAPRSPGDNVEIEAEAGSFEPAVVSSRARH